MFSFFAAAAWIITVIVSVCFALDYFSDKGGARFNWSLALAVLLWTLYSCYETFAVDPVRDNIRADLLVIYPVLIIVSGIGLIQWLKK